MSSTLDRNAFPSELKYEGSDNKNTTVKRFYSWKPSEQQQVVVQLTWSGRRRTSPLSVQISSVWVCGSSPQAATGHRTVAHGPGWWSAAAWVNPQTHCRPLTLTPAPMGPPLAPKPDGRRQRQTSFSSKNKSSMRSERFNMWWRKMDVSLELDTGPNVSSSNDRGVYSAL